MWHGAIDHTHDVRTDARCSHFRPHLSPGSPNEEPGSTAAITSPSSDETLVVGAVHSPVGTFHAALSSAGLCCLAFPGDPLDACERWVRRWIRSARRSDDRVGLDWVSTQLTAYFEGQIREFSVPLDLRGTPFQLQVWNSLRTIPYGETRSYAQVAMAISRPRAVRAVGAANGQNPIPILVPCHRVVGSNGALVGYGGGLDTKRFLLDLERAAR